MNFDDLLSKATDKRTFDTLQGYIDFAAVFIEFAEDNLQARIVSRNEPHYQFLQYGPYASYQVTRPINTHLLCGPNEFQEQCRVFIDALDALASGITPDQGSRQTINRLIYTLQQTIGATLDGLPVGRGNRARKLNGDYLNAWFNSFSTKLACRACPAQSRFRFRLVRNLILTPISR